MSELFCILHLKLVDHCVDYTQTEDQTGHSFNITKVQSLAGHSNISLLSALNKVKSSVSTLVKKFFEFKQIKTFTGLSLLSLLCFVFLN